MLKLFSKNLDILNKDALNALYVDLKNKQNKKNKKNIKIRDDSNSNGRNGIVDLKIEDSSK